MVDGFTDKTCGLGQRARGMEQGVYEAGWEFHKKTSPLRYAPVEVKGR